MHSSYRTEDSPVYVPHILHYSITFQLVDEPTPESSDIVVDKHTLIFTHLKCFILHRPQDLTFTVSADTFCSNEPLFVALSPPSYSMADTHILGCNISPNLCGYRCWYLL